MNSKLQHAQQVVASAQAEVDADNAAVQAVQDQVAALQAQINELRERQAAKHLHEKLAAGKAALVAAEEAAVKDMAIELAGEIMQKQAADPVRHCGWITAQVAKLRTMVRAEIDTPISEKYSQHPVITQALTLLPPLNVLDKPVHELGYIIAGHSDWSTRRRKILAEAQANQAA